MRYRFKFLIFQHGQLSEELEVEQEFKHLDDLIIQLIKFAAMQSSVAIHDKVIPLHSGCTIQLPITKEGYGPATTVVISKITWL